MHAHATSPDADAAEFSARFWSKIDRSGGPAACWEWRGALLNGYGRNGSVGPGGSRLAHRIVWELTRGEIPAGLCACHRCDNPTCCNPAHLFLGTIPENNIDMTQKGRRKFGFTPKDGERNNNARLTADDVRAIRSAYDPGVVTMAEIARRFGVNETAVWKIVNRKRWAHVK